MAFFRKLFYPFANDCRPVVFFIYLISALSPFFLLMLAAGWVTPIIPPILALSGVHAWYRLRMFKGEPPGAFLKFARNTYYVMLVFALIAVLRLSFLLFSHFFTFTVAVLAFLAVMKRVRFFARSGIYLSAIVVAAYYLYSAFNLKPGLCLIVTGIILIAAVKRVRFEVHAGIFLNIATLVLFSLFSAQTMSPDVMQKLSGEKYVRPVFLFKDIYSLNASNLYGGLLGIKDSRDGRYIYFTAKESQKAGVPGYYSLYRVDLDNPKNLTKWSHDRMSDLAIIDCDSKILATDYKNGRLWMLDATTLKPIRSVATKKHPLFIITDERYRRVIVSHEGLTSYLIFSLPDLRLIGSVFNSTCPEWIAVDKEKERFYTANICSYPYLLSEVDLRTLKGIRRQFHLRLFSMGVGLDRKRDLIYVSAFVSGVIHVADQETLHRVTSFKTMPGVRAVVPDEKRGLIYVGNMIDPYLRVYRPDYTLLAKIYIGGICRVIYISPHSGRVFAGSMYGLLEIKADELLKNASIHH
jgi:hypothetical protein